jgi:integrase
MAKTSSALASSCAPLLPAPTFQRLPDSLWPADCKILLDEPVEPADPFERQRPWHRNSRKTRDLRRRDLGIFLDWLQESGRYQANLKLAKQVTRDFLRAFEADMSLAGLKPGTRCFRFSSLYACLRELAPRKKWQWVLDAAKKLERRAAKHLAERHVPSTGMLIDLGLKLIRQAEDKGTQDSALDRATLFRDGLIILFLALHAPRRGALQVMTRGKNIRRLDTKTIIEWAAGEMKRGRKGYLTELDPRVAAIFDRYFEFHWPVLLDQAKTVSADAAGAVWLSTRGTQMCESAISKQVGRRTKLAFGKAVNLHSFRHAGCTTIAIEFPELAWVVTPWLNHATSSTAQEVYNLATSLEASERFGAALDEIRFGHAPAK